MESNFVHVRGRDFAVGDRKIIFRGYGFGNWLNLEHFMLGLPGTESQIRKAIQEAYGDERAEAFWRKYQECYITEDDFIFLKNLGVNAVRIPFNYHLFESDQAPYCFDEHGFIPIDRVLALCEKYEIYGILDLHAVPGGQNPDWHADNALGESLFWEYADFRKRVIALWQYIAARYKDNPWIAAYDFLNEPVLFVEDKSLLDSFFSELIQKVRTVDPNHMFFIEGDRYAVDFTAFNKLTDVNVACTFHFYPLFFEENLPEVGRREAIENILFNHVTLDDIRDRLTRPIWCGETGALFSKGDRANQEDMLRDMLAILEKHEISWSLWSFKDARSMGTLHPKADSSWMKFSETARAEWEFWNDYKEATAMVDQFLAKYPADVSETLRRKLWYRVLANYQYILVERYRKLFSEIPFDELLTYPESFRFDQCETWDAIIAMVRGYTEV